jgi:outer membrane protein assembly factor BamD
MTGRPAQPVCRRTPGHWGLRLTGCLITVLTLACGARSAEIPDPQLEADRLLFERGTEALAENDWRRAREYFASIRDNYPQSQYRAEAFLSIGDTYEAEGTLEAYVQALEEYSDFLTLFPIHPRAPYAQFKVGMVHFHQMRRAERDQTETLNAIREFETFLVRYPPDHELLPQVQQQLREARDRLSEHDYIVGLFYYRFKNFPGAVSRFRQILDTDPGYTGRDAVYFHIGESLAETNQISEAIPYFARILDEFEESEFAVDASLRIAELESDKEP